jgi:hypothetical protein
MLRSLEPSEKHEGVLPNVTDEIAEDAMQETRRENNKADGRPTSSRGLLE